MSAARTIAVPAAPAMAQPFFERRNRTRGVTRGDSVRTSFGPVCWSAQRRSAAEREPCFRRLRQQALHDGGQRAAAGEQDGQIVMDDRVQGVDGVLAREGTLSRHAASGVRRQREEIGPLIDRLSLYLLGCEVAGRAQDHARERCEPPWQRGILHELRDAEVQDLGGARSSDEDRLSGLRSRWTSPHACAATRPPVTAHAMRRASSSETGPRPIGTRKASPSRSSVTRYGRPFDIPTSNTLTMLGWSSDAVMRASCRNRSIACTSPRSVLVSVLRAMSLLSCGSSARTRLQCRREPGVHDIRLINGFRERTYSSTRLRAA